MLDIKIVGGTVHDGSGLPGVEADVGVKGDVIETVGDLSTSEAVLTIDATSKSVTPGFIDLHTHSDASFLVDPLADSKLTQGVTLEYFGNCGMSFCAPLYGAARDQLRERLTRGGEGTFEVDWQDFDGYLNALERRGSAINIATQVGHGTVRSAVMGMDNRGPDIDELQHMIRLVEESLDAGALGMSTGLWYAPGSYSLTDEVIALNQPVADRDKLYSSHIRSEADDLCGLFPAHAEAIEIGRRTGGRIQVSHVKAVGPKFWGRGPEILEGFERAIDEGIDVAGDQYPYSWSSTGFSGAMFARWSLTGGREATLDRLKDDDLRAKMREDTRYYISRNHGAAGSVVAHFPPNSDYEGRSLEDIGHEMGCEPAEAALRLYEQSDGSYVLNTMEEDDVEAIAKWRLMAVCSDGSSLRTTGPLSSGVPHPRSYATNSRHLETFVKERELMPFEEAIYKMTSLGAARLNLKRRGRIARGMYADINVFALDNVKQNNTFNEPHQYSTGMDHVIVNGVQAIADGEVTGATPGKVLRDFDA